MKVRGANLLSRLWLPRLKTLAEPALQQQCEHEQCYQRKSEVRALASLFKRLDGNDLGAYRFELRLHLARADFVETRFEERGIDRINLRHRAVLVTARRYGQPIKTSAIVIFDRGHSAFLRGADLDIAGL